MPVSPSPLTGSPPSRLSPLVDRTRQWPRSIACAFLAGILLLSSGCGRGDERPETSSTVTGAQPTVTPRNDAARPTAADTPTSAIAAMEREVVQRINDIRREQGLPALEVDQELAGIARDYSCRMARQDFFSHTGPDGGTVADRVRQAGKEYRLVGENIARNTNAREPAEAAVQGWMDSAQHRENILRRGVTETGVGICRDGARYYFTQVFMQPR